MLLHLLGEGYRLVHYTMVFKPAQKQIPIEHECNFLDQPAHFLFPAPQLPAIRVLC